MPEGWALAEQQYLQLYEQYLDEPDRSKRAELVAAMNEIESKHGWI